MKGPPTVSHGIQNLTNLFSNAVIITSPQRLTKTAPSWIFLHIGILPQPCSQHAVQEVALTSHVYKPGKQQGCQ